MSGESESQCCAIKFENSHVRLGEEFFYGQTEDNLQLPECTVLAALLNHTHCSLVRTGTCTLKWNSNAACEQ